MTWSWLCIILFAASAAGHAIVVLRDFIQLRRRLEAHLGGSGPSGGAGGTQGDWPRPRPSGSGAEIEAQLHARIRELESQLAKLESARGGATGAAGGTEGTPGG